LQNAGFAGAIRPDGVGARSETASDEAGCIWAESTRTASAAGPTRPLQVEEGLPTRPDADAGETGQAAESRTAAAIRASIIVLIRSCLSVARIQMSAPTRVNQRVPDSEC
jgi:hypothetical protein